MLRENYNPNSEYHLPNPETGRLLHTAATRSARQPATVMLGHISSQRNKAKLALAEVKKTFVSENDEMDFRLLASPLYEPSEVVTIAD